MRVTVEYHPLVGRFTSVGSYTVHALGRRFDCVDRAEAVHLARVLVAGLEALGERVELITP